MLILASASPRRKELLTLISDDFTVMPSDVKENAGERDPGKLVRALAAAKAQDIAAKKPGDTVIGADTIVYVGGQILGKPANRDEAKHMMQLLSGRDHKVFTGVCVISGGKTLCETFETTVTFNHIGNIDLETYLGTAHYQDKAGAYAIQEQAAKFIKKIDGDFFNVMGLPVSGLYQMLRQIGAIAP